MTPPILEEIPDDPIAQKYKPKKESKSKRSLKEKFKSLVLKKKKSASATAKSDSQSTDERSSVKEKKLGLQEKFSQFQAKKKKKKLSPLQLRHKRRHRLTMAGYENLDLKKVNKIIFQLAIGINLIVTGYILYLLAKTQSSLFKAIGITFLLWTIGFGVSIVLAWLAFRTYINYKIFMRKLELEKVLPDYLELTSLNIKAGMPIDRALWYSVRPRFGVLAKEIEVVAKKTLTGHDLDKSLIAFANKFDSDTLKRAVNLINEGMKAGGEVGDLLNKIALNIHESEIMKKEMAASVMTYVIFITFAAIVASPFLMALANQLLAVVTGLASNIDLPSGGAVGIAFSLSEDSIKLSDFRIFSYVSLTITAFFSGMIISIIRRGNAKEGIRQLPVYIAVALTIFWIASKVLSNALGGILLQ
ncbi:type II secretion system F family protein [Candidatus Woesearchaeota archaeon]|nr:type II secretion system F family protein [Candidatus Woesearchaeota archaeon]